MHFRSQLHGMETTIVSWQRRFAIVANLRDSQRLFDAECSHGRNYAVRLKRFLSIFSDLIFDSRVDPGIPSLAAAPDEPATRPPHSRRATSISSFSVEADILDNCGWLCGGCVRGCRESQLSSTVKVSVSLTMTERSITFCSSRILPGQGYDWSRSRLFLSIAWKFFPAFLA